MFLYFLCFYVEICLFVGIDIPSTFMWGPFRKQPSLDFVFWDIRLSCSVEFNFNWTSLEFLCCFFGCDLWVLTQCIRNYKVRGSHFICRSHKNGVSAIVQEVVLQRVCEYMGVNPVLFSCSLVSNVCYNLCFSLSCCYGSELQGQFSPHLQSDLLWVRLSVEELNLPYCINWSIHQDLSRSGSWIE